MSVRGPCEIDLVPFILVGIIIPSKIIIPHPRCEEISMTDRAEIQSINERLRQVHQSLSIQLDGSTGHEGYLLHCDDVTLPIRLASTNQRDVESIKAQFAKALVEASAEKAESLNGDAILVHATRIGRRALTQLERFIRGNTEVTNWIALDDRGTVRVMLPGCGIDVVKHGEDEANVSSNRQRNTRAFTDLNRWLLKVMLLVDAPGGMWPDDSSLRTHAENPLALKDIGKVSQPKAYQFARTFRDLGLLEWDRQAFRILDRARLFERWREDERQLSGERLPVRSLFQPGQQLRSLTEQFNHTLEYAVGGFAACELHDVLHTTPRTPVIHVFGEFHDYLHKADLESCSERDADAILLSMPYTESIKRGRVRIRETTVVDILQAALDTSRVPARGIEQSDYIVREVLKWG